MSTIDFWFDFSCPYAYLGSTQIHGLAERTGAELRLKPMLLGGVFRAVKTDQNLFATLSPAKARHNAADMHRFARLWDVPLKMPSGHPFRTVTALRSLLVVGEPWDELMRAFYEAYWVDGRDLGDDAVVAEVLAAAGHDAAAVLEATQRQAIKDELRRRTDEAIELGVFGAPTIVADGQLYWGQDRFDQVERALGGTPAPLSGGGGPLAPVDFWFDYSSPFACLGAMRAEAVLGDAARWRPMLLGAVFKQVEQVLVPFNTLSPAKRRWVAADIGRQAKAIGFDFKWPSRFPMNTVLPLRVTLLADAPATPGGRELIRSIFRAYWSDDRDISDPGVVAELCDANGFDGADLVERAREAKQALFDETGAAVEAGVFGAPAWIVRHEGHRPALFWGADRLDLAAAAAAGDERLLG